MPYNTMRLALSFQLIIGLAAGNLHLSGIQREWEHFKITFNKHYTPVEDVFRMRVFAKNKEEIAEHNRLSTEGKQPYRMGINQFADMLNRENRSTLNGFLITGSERNTHVSFLRPHSDVALPDSVDWRHAGAVTPVKSQNGCGSCWAFSAVASLEGQQFRKTGELVGLSVQELVDCSKDNHGCGGGTMDEAFKDIQQMGGIDTEVDYPYIGLTNQCHFNKSAVGAHVKGVVDIPPGDEEALKAAVALTGPVSVGIDASWISFRRYAEGVYSDPLCSPTNLGHGVTVVGYGTLGGQDYWLVKNSWGKTWGNQGYIYMARNMDNMCGIATMASYPLV